MPIRRPTGPLPLGNKPARFQGVRATPIKRESLERSRSGGPAGFLPTNIGRDGRTPFKPGFREDYQPLARNTVSAFVDTGSAVRPMFQGFGAVPTPARRQAFPGENAELATARAMMGRPPLGMSSSPEAKAYAIKLFKSAQAYQEGLKGGS